MQVKQPHKHAAVIKAWADGAEIEYLYRESDGRDPEIWCIVQTPCWDNKTQYRIKQFPKSTLDTNGLLAAYFGVEAISLPIQQTYSISAETHMRRVADAAIKQYILDTEASK